MSSSTSSSNITQKWKACWQWGKYAFIISLAISTIFILLVNPYNIDPVLTPKVHMATNQRFTYPAIAKDPQFDSVVIGTSTTRLLAPELLNKTFNAQFTNLSMNDLTPYEQYKTVELFLRHHPTPKYMILGIDINLIRWCSNLEQERKHTRRGFPLWQYDETKWNDYLPQINAKSIEIAGRKLGYIFNNQPEKYAWNGYADFTLDKGTYDIKKAKEKIYSQFPSTDIDNPDSLLLKPTPLHFTSTYNLKNILDIIPNETTLIITFPPYHWYHQASFEGDYGIRLMMCKRELLKIIKEHRPATPVKDFNTLNWLTTKDEHYWDHHHYRREHAERIIQEIYEAL